MFNGPAYWRVIHYCSINDNCRELLQQLGDFISCEKCRSGYRPPTNDEDLQLWSINFHNIINKQIGKDCSQEFYIKSTCDICTSEVPAYPWEFIHNVAEFAKDDAIEFLKTFNNTYPCNNCRGNLLMDDKNTDENCLFWTLRNRKQFCEKNTLPSFIYIMDPPVSDSNCIGCANQIIKEPVN